MRPKVGTPGAPTASACGSPHRWMIALGPQRNAERIWDMWGGRV
eukprot:CAMPEP_0184510382 /NCGR_PEP_ID=MMETSP0198_2-20121128/1782_1 /TAXON_ID=1112570 /ORGANISM="Thraustochytrium sp., Strain LLF1b" /LENGTH=43 /DNA_ID= /DNA_START= /DNA_END= /DNA_ORIENTATION=